MFVDGGESVVYALRAKKKKFSREMAGCLSLQTVVLWKTGNVMG